MKDADLLAAACELEVVRPVHTPKLNHNHPVSVDLIAILDPFDDTGTNAAFGHHTRDIWLGRSLPRTFQGSRILAYRRARSVGLDTGSAVDIETFASRFWDLLSIFRQRTNTTNIPFVIILHNNSGVKMLSTLIIALLTALERGIYGLETNARGIVCLEANQPERRLHYDILPLPSSDLSSNLSIHDQLNNSLLRYGTRLPVTVFLDEELQLEPSQEPRLNPYVWKFFEPHVKTASMMFTALGHTPYPSSSSSTIRVLGEIRKFLSQYIEPSFVGVEGAQFRRWLFPSKALFQYETPRIANGSGAWLFRHKSYRSWIESDKNELLWLTGKPGSGKSTLMKHLLDSIRHDDAVYLQAPVIAASIMFDFRYVLEREKGSAKGPLVRALLYQMLESDPSLLPSLYKTLSPLSPLHERPEDLDDRYYQTWLEAALAAATDKATVFLLIDGLDECDPDLQEDLIACLEPICQGPKFTRKVRIMISSRWGPSMQQIQRRCQTSIRRLEMENSEDIARFCQAMLLPRRTGSVSTFSKDSKPCNHWKDSVEQLVESIISRADGVFLWVSLVIGLLLNDYPKERHPQCNTKTWHQAVQELPVDLNSLYENLIDRIPIQSKATSATILMWCAYAFRPLDYAELDSLFQGIGEDVEPERSWVQSPAISMASRLRRMTYGLVEVVSDPRSNISTVQFVHATVKDFLTKDGTHLVTPRSDLPQSPAGLAHTAMAQTCVRCIRRMSSRKDEAVDPFFKYSVLYWGFHARAGERLAIPQEYLIEQFQWPSTKLTSRWLEEHEKASNPRAKSAKDTSLLHIAAHYGLSSTVRALFVQTPKHVSLDRKDCSGHTALYHAAMQGHEDIVCLLLDHGATVDAEGTEKSSPVLAAAQKGRSSILATLLEQGAGVNVRDETERTALMLAVGAGHAEVARLLLANGADLNGLDANGHSVLTLAVASGNQELAESILKLNNTTWPVTVLGAALSFAVALGLTTLARAILLTDKFGGPEDTFVQQCFITAVVSGSEEVLLLFLKLGCHPDTYDSKYGQSALSIAAAGGYDRLVRLLLDYGAHANIQDVRSGTTPIVHAIRHGYPIVVQLLLDHGAGIDFTEDSCRHAGEGWIYKVILAFVYQCPSGGNGRSSNNKSSNSSTKTILGSPTAAGSPPSSSDQGQKRRRTQNGQDDSEGGSDDDRAVVKKPRQKDEEPDKQFMCPFQKRFPEKHTCPAYARVPRLKEHIHRRHHKVFCVDCWEIFTDEAAVTRHHKNDGCERQERKDFSGGICNSQASRLKSRKGIQRISEEKHWRHVFRIVFPDFSGTLPSPLYYITSETFTAGTEQMFRDPCLRSELESIVGGQYEAVRNTILAFARNQRLNEVATSPAEASEVPASLAETIEVRPTRHVPATPNPSGLEVPVSTVGHTSGNDDLRLFSQHRQRYPSHQSLGPMDRMPLRYSVPDLQSTSFTTNRRLSDSGFGTQPGSTAEEPQTNGMYVFGASDFPGTVNSDQSSQPIPCYPTSVTSFSTAHDFFMEPQHLGGQDNVPMIFDNVNDFPLDPMLPDNHIPNVRLPDQSFGVSQQGEGTSSWSG